MQALRGHAYGALAAVLLEKSVMSAAKNIPSIRRISGVQTVPSVRSQAACVRTLLDEVERTLPAELADPMSAQLIEELGRLGCGCVELAAALSKIADEQTRARVA